MNEVWKDIEEYVGLYQVSTLGRVKSLYSGKVLKESTNNEWHYSRVQLYKNKKRKSFGIHRLVAMAFIPNPENKPEVNHKNGIKTDNSVENLEWCTGAENMQHAFKILGYKSPMFGKKGKQNPESRIVLQIKDGVIINCFHGLREASRATGVYHGTISKCCRGNRYYKTAGGYQWQYKEA